MFPDDDEDDYDGVVECHPFRVCVCSPSESINTRRREKKKSAIKRFVSDLMSSVWCHEWCPCQGYGDNDIDNDGPLSASELNNYNIRTYIIILYSLFLIFDCWAIR
jgi:hypothetical protein